MHLIQYEMEVLHLLVIAVEWLHTNRCNFIVSSSCKGVAICYEMLFCGFLSQVEYY